MSTNDANGHCVHCGRDNKGYEHLPCADDCPGEEAFNEAIDTCAHAVVDLFNRAGFAVLTDITMQQSADLACEIADALRPVLSKHVGTYKGASK
jgi:hypothetical protein